MTGLEVVLLVIVFLLLILLFVVLAARNRRELDLLSTVIYLRMKMVDITNTDQMFYASAIANTALDHTREVIDG
jgi:hypothetical protein